jgi:hypothetical protein
VASPARPWTSQNGGGAGVAYPAAVAVHVEAVPYQPGELGRNPAIHEVGVGRVDAAARESHPGAASCRVTDLELQHRHKHRVGSRANLDVRALGRPLRVGHVRPVVGTVGVATVPAIGEGDPQHQHPLLAGRGFGEGASHKRRASALPGERPIAVLLGGTRNHLQIVGKWPDRLEVSPSGAVVGTHPRRGHRGVALVKGWHPVGGVVGSHVERLVVSGTAGCASTQPGVG